MSTEAMFGPSGHGTVVMEVGGNVGALILYTPAELDGEEIEISRDGEVACTHSLVRPRHVPSGTRYAAVYPGLPAGRYTVWHDRDRPAAVSVSAAAAGTAGTAGTAVTGGDTVTVTVTGGEITTCHWTG